MASIVKRNKSFSVVYGYKNLQGEYKRKWETYHSEEEALKRKQEIEDPISFLNEKIRVSRFNDLLDEFVQLYGQRKWGVSTYSGNTRLMDNYIRPLLGNVPIFRIDRHLINKYFLALSKTPSAGGRIGTERSEYVTENTIFEVYKILHSIFQQAIHWGYFKENMVTHIGLRTPKYNPRKALFVDQITMVTNEAIKRDDYLLALTIQLAFSCSLRKGEILGLCWKDIDFDNNSIFVNKELIRVSNEALETLRYRGIFFVIPPGKPNSKSSLVLKDPKTTSSVRTVYMIPSVAKLLMMWKERQYKYKTRDEYQDYDLVLSGVDGRPLCPKQCNIKFKRILNDVGLPEVVFHSLRHSSTSYKLILSNGNIKAVQGDNGHAQPDMVLSVYAQINDAERKKLALEMERSFGSTLSI